jgi:hypothetical protein
VETEEGQTHESSQGRSSSGRSRSRTRIRTLSPEQILKFAEEAVAAAEAEVARLQKYRATASRTGDSGLLSHYDQDLSRATKVVETLSGEVASLKATLQPQ